MKWKELNELVICFVKSITYEFKGVSSQEFFSPSKQFKPGKNSKKKAGDTS